MKRKLILLGVSLAIVAITALAGAVRVYDIKNYPPGLFPDVAANGEDALLILKGDRRPFYPRGNGREALFFYLDAIAIKTFGIGVWQMYLGSIVVGIATVVAIYFATSVYFGRLAGLLAAAFLATSSWHVALSRTGFRAIMVPLFVALFTWFAGRVVQAVKKKQIGLSYWYAVLSGVAFSGGFYTYIAYRSMIGVVLGIVVLLLLAALHPKIGLPHIKKYRSQAGIALACAILVILPLVSYFYYHPKEFIGRAGQVSVFSPHLQQQFGGGTLLGTLQYSVTGTILSFFTHGDINWRQNVSGYPLLNPLVGLLFLLGLIFVLKGTWDVFVKMTSGKIIHLGMIFPYLLLVLLGMMAPVVTTAEGIPHALRSVGMAAPIYIMAGFAGALCIRYVLAWAKKKKIIGIAYGAIIGIIIVFGMYDISLYFVISRNSPEAYIEYRGDLTVISAYIKEYAQRHPNNPRPILDIDPYFAQTTHFLDSVGASDYTDHSLDSKQLYSVADSTKGLGPLVPAGQQIIFTQSTMWDADQYAQKYKGSIKLITTQVNKFGAEIMRVYEGVKPAAPDNSFDLDA